MSARISLSLPFLALIIMGVLLAGCISTGVGDVTYREGNLTIPVTSPAQEDAYIQVTVFRITDLRQEEAAVFGAPVSLAEGENRVTIPGRIGPGEYKLIIYVIYEGTRRAAVIRDIRV